MARPLGPVPEHGTRQRYQLRHDPCRCLPCRAANRRYITERRNARRAKRAPDGPKWSEVKLPPEFMVKCTHSSQEHNSVCAWCGTPIRQAV